MSVFQHHQISRTDDYCTSDVAGFVGRDAETLSRLANEHAVEGKVITFQHEGIEFTAELQPDDFFEDGYSITVECTNDIRH